MLIILQTNCIQHNVFEKLLVTQIVNKSYAGYETQWFVPPLVNTPSHKNPVHPAKIRTEYLGSGYNCRQFKRKGLRIIEKTGN